MSKDPKEYIERLDNPQLSESEQFDLGMESDFNMNADHMMAYQEAEWFDGTPSPEELEEDERQWQLQKEKENRDEH